MQKNYKAFKYVPYESKEDRELVLAAVRIDGCILEYASEQMQNDREVVLAAVRQNGMALKYADPQLRNNREVVLAAVKKDARALSCASDVLKGDVSVVAKAVNNNIPSLLFAKLEHPQDIADAVAGLGPEDVSHYVKPELRYRVLRLMGRAPNASVAQPVSSYSCNNNAPVQHL